MGIVLKVFTKGKEYVHELTDRKSILEITKDSWVHNCISNDKAFYIKIFGSGVALDIELIKTSKTSRINLLARVVNPTETKVTIQTPEGAFDTPNSTLDIMSTLGKVNNTLAGRIPFSFLDPEHKPSHMEDYKVVQIRLVDKPDMEVLASQYEPADKNSTSSEMSSLSIRYNLPTLEFT